jgi:N-acetylneuraminic acid mutarotase
LGAYLLPVNSRWEFITSKPATPAISRHAVVSQGNYVYVVGGQTGKQIGEEGELVMSNQLLRFDTTSDRWDTMAQIPGAGYSNSTAALLNNHIYLPSGYNGNNLGYDGLHWAYDIAQNSWKTVASIPTADLPDGQPFAWAAAAVPPAKTRYYLAGGMSSTDPLAPTANVSAETYSYTPAADSWIKLKPMQAARYAHTAAWININNYGLCVAGGLGVDTLEESGDPVTILHRSVECYLPGGEWRYIGDLNIPRFGAGSVVGPDGNWYVFGGITVDGNGLRAVASTEVYNPRLNTWTVMDSAYDLGSYRSMPARFWPRGAMVGDNLWVMGGSIVETAEEALPTIDRLRIPSHTALFPVTIGSYSDAERPDDSMATARSMGFGGYQRRNFDQQRDFFDFYTFNLPQDGRVNIYLDVPDDNNFDLELYGQNKLLWGSSKSPKNGDNEEISLLLPRRRYYIRVSRAFPTEKPDKGAYYTLTLN